MPVTSPPKLSGLKYDLSWSYLSFNVDLDMWMWRQEILCIWKGKNTILSIGEHSEYLISTHLRVILMLKVDKPTPKC